MFGVRLQRIGGRGDRKRWLDEGAIFVSRVTAILASAITAAVTARYLGPTGRGEYYFGVIVAGLIAQIANCGLSSANFYYSARCRDHIRTILVATVIISISTCALLTAGYFIIVKGEYILSWKTEFDPLFIFGLAVCYLLAATIPSCLIGMRRHFVLSAGQVTTALLGVVFMLTVALLSPTVLAFGFATLVTVGMLPTLCMFLLWSGATENSTERQQRSSFLREWLIYGFRAFPPIMLAYLAGRGTMFTVHAVIDAQSFGVLSISYQVFEAILAAPQSIAMVMFPALVAGGDVSMARLGRECARMGAISIAIILLIIITFREILTIVFGHEYEESYHILLWYLPGFMGYSIVSICSQFLAFFRFPWTNSVIWAVGGVAGVAASFYGASRFGAPGAAAGASMGWLVVAAGLILVTICEINKRKRPAAGWNREGAVDER